MTGNANLAVTVVGANTSDISRITDDLSDIGLDINDESVIEGE
jgi:hypothetical protein